MLVMLKATRGCCGLLVLLSPKLLHLCLFPFCPSAPLLLSGGLVHVDGLARSAVAILILAISTQVSPTKKCRFFLHTLHPPKQLDSKVRLCMGGNLKAVIHPHKQNKAPASQKHFQLAQVLKMLLVLSLAKIKGRSLFWQSQNRLLICIALTHLYKQAWPSFCN